MAAADDYVGQPFHAEASLYKSVFENSPLPMWIYDLDTLRFLAVNDAAVHKYGYSRSEFLGMTTSDLRPSGDSETDGKQSEANPVVKEWRGWRHRLKNGEIIEVEITTQGLKVEGRTAALAIISPFQRKDRQEENAEPSNRNVKPAIKNDGAPTILFEPDTGKIEDANDSAAALFQCTREKLLSYSLSDIIAIEGSEETDVPKELLEIVNGVSKKIRTAGDGETRKISVQVSEISFGDRKFGYLVVLPEAPVPETKEESGRESGDLRKIIELSPDGYYRRTADWKFLDVNSSFADMLGYSREQLISGELKDPVYLGLLDGDEAESVRDATGADEVHRLRKSDGQEIWIEEQVQAMHEGDGNEESFEGFCSEVTLEEEEQADKDQSVNLLAGLSEIFLLVRESDGMIVDANAAAEAAHGLSREELLEKTIYDLRAEDSAESVRQQIFAADGEAQVFETAHRRKDGSAFPVETVLQRLTIGDEDFLVSVSRDTTKRTKAEAELKLSEEKYRTIFEKSPFGILYFDMNGVITDCNESLAAIMGSSRKSIVGLRLLDLPSKELVGAVRDVLAGKLGQYRGNYRSFTANKTIRVRTTFTPLTSSGGKPAGGMAIFEDITEQDNADAALKEREKRYRLLYENSPVPYHLLDAEWKISDVNNSWVDLLGFKKHEVVGKNFEEFVASENVRAFGESIKNFKASGVLGNLEVDILCKDGRRITAAVEAKLVRDGKGAILQSQFMLYDVTERRMAENALRESEQKFRSLAETASSAIFMYQKDKICYANAACAEVTGYSCEELAGMNFWDVVHPDFRDLVRELGMRRQKGEPVPNHYELRIRTKSGDSRWIDFTGASAQFNGELAVLGTVYDATERKNARKKLEESEEQHRLLVEKSPDAIMVFTDGKLVYLNPAALGLMSADSPEKLIGKPVSELAHHDSAGETASVFERARKTLKSVEMKNLKFVRSDGSSFKSDVVASPITYLGRPSVQLIARSRTGQPLIAQKSTVHDVALNTISSAIAVTDADYNVKWANPAFETLTGYTVSESTGRNVFDLSGSGEHNEEFLGQIRDSVLAGRTWHGDMVCRRKNGSKYAEELTITPVKDDSDKVADLVFVKQDSTLRESFEEQLLQAKKLEGIGQMVGAVVHDYNNILSVILGYSDFLKKHLKEQDPLLLPVDAILSATRRGADLTKQLLDFEQEGVVSPKVVDVNKAILTMGGTFRKALGDDLKMEFTPTPGLWDARIDPINLYEILVNLAANARDAIMDGAGTLEVKASNVMVDENFAEKHGRFEPGEYVMISFADTGKGIDGSVMERLFEPFVTTKHEEHTAGLGLAAVYGMIKRSKGGITVRSTPGEGTTFCVYLPRGDHENAEPVEDIVQAEDLHSDKTVLLVEDQGDLLTLVKQTLEGYGYRALAALGPEEALDICESYPEKIDVLLSDVILPGINGNELSDKVLAMRPDIHIIFMSGYSADALTPGGLLEKNAQFLQKPFTADELGRKLYSVLGSASREA